MKIIIAIIDILLVFFMVSQIAQGNPLLGIGVFVGACLVEAYIHVKLKG